MKKFTVLLVFVLFISCRDKPVIIDCTEHYNDYKINHAQLKILPKDSIPAIGGGLPFKQTKLPKPENSKNKRNKIITTCFYDITLIYSWYFFSISKINKLIQLCRSMI